MARSVKIFLAYYLPVITFFILAFMFILPKFALATYPSCSDISNNHPECTWMYGGDFPPYTDQCNKDQYYDDSLCNVDLNPAHTRISATECLAKWMPTYECITCTDHTPSYDVVGAYRCPKPVPTCNATAVCDTPGSCVPATNTCYTGNGTEKDLDCRWTTYSGSTNCTQAAAPDQTHSCTQSNCSTGYQCSADGNCVPPCWTCAGANYSTYISDSTCDDGQGTLAGHSYATCGENYTTGSLCYSAACAPSLACTSNTSTCADGNPCSLDCTSSNLCLEHVCNTSTNTCSFPKQTDGTVYDNSTGLVCCNGVATAGTSCAPPQCTTANAATVCNDPIQNPCKVGVCNNGTCGTPTNVAEGTSCTPPNGGTCKSGTCSLTTNNSCTLSGMPTSITLLQGVTDYQQINLTVTGWNSGTSFINFSLPTCSDLYFGPGSVSCPAGTITSIWPLPNAGYLSSSSLSTYIYRSKVPGTVAKQVSVSVDNGATTCATKNYTVTYNVPSVTIKGKNVDVNGNALTSSVGSGQSITLSQGGTTLGNSASLGAWSFSSEPLGTYTVKAVIPTGYAVSYSYSGINISPPTASYTPCTSNPCSVSTGNLSANGYLADIYFKYTPLYSISGNVFYDADSNGCKNNSATKLCIETSNTTESNCNTNGTTCPAVTVTVDGGSPISPGTGSYTFDNLAAGSHSIAFSMTDPLYKFTYPVVVGTTNTLPVIVGTGCAAYDAQATKGALCSASGSITNLNAGVNLAVIKPAWFQSIGSDMRWDSGFIDPLPSLSTTTYASMPGLGGTPGIIFSGGTDPSFGTDGGKASGDVVNIANVKWNWKVGSFSYPDYYSTSHNTIFTSYNYLLGTVNKSTNVVKKVLLSDFCTAGTGQTNCALKTDLTNAAYLIDLSGGTLTLSGPNYTFPAGKNFVILVNGSIVINNKIWVPNTSTVVFSASRDITVSSTVGEPAATPCTISSHAGCDIEGLYSANNNFIADGKNASGTYKCSSGADLRLNIAGTVIANAGRGTGTFANYRTLCGNNTTQPSVTFTERPDFLLNYPSLVGQSSGNLQNVAP